MPKRPRKDRSETADDVTFVKTCLELKNAPRVAQALGMATASVHARCARLRKAGVKLPAFGREKREVDVSALNRLISEMKKGG